MRDNKGHKGEARAATPLALNDWTASVMHQELNKPEKKGGAEELSPQTDFRDQTDVINQIKKQRSRCICPLVFLTT